VIDRRGGTGHDYTCQQANSPVFDGGATRFSRLPVAHFTPTRWSLPSGGEGNADRVVNRGEPSRTARPRGSPNRHGPSLAPLLHPISGMIPRFRGLESRPGRRTGDQDGSPGSAGMSGMPLRFSPSSEIGSGMKMDAGWRRPAIKGFDHDGARCRRVLPQSSGRSPLR
jgi:hypothetical protein